MGKRHKQKRRIRHNFNHPPPRLIRWVQNIEPITKLKLWRAVLR